MEITGKSRKNEIAENVAYKFKQQIKITIVPLIKVEGFARKEIT